MKHSNAILTGSIEISGSISADRTLNVTVSSATTSSNATTSSVMHNTYLQSGSIKFWSGPKTAYDAISGSADPNTIYFTTE